MSKCKKLSQILHGVRKARLKPAIYHLFPSTCIVPKFDHVISDLFTAQDAWGLVSVATADGQKPVESGLQEGKEQ